jgi:hypothetical protein
MDSILFKDLKSLAIIDGYSLSNRIFKTMIDSCRHSLKWLSYQRIHRGNDSSDKFLHLDQFFGPELRSVWLSSNIQLRADLVSVVGNSPRLALLHLDGESFVQDLQAIMKLPQTLLMLRFRSLPFKYLNGPKYLVSELDRAIVDDSWCPSLRILELEGSLIPLETISKWKLHRPCLEISGVRHSNFWTIESR